ncbi:hypothetical protein CWO85_02615 [Candidatus Phytoplasma ziziphi]|uniref:Type I restriction modification DNA specificity domain-containing protein n=1 Tax=Ziziphus jujuba witches'-broom phytoplasma TaxID=135727 RepID=A0A660HMW9_ZIZJU|nr:restriction endonuclease subunit S [Candidatus Phytoplasma ziziphi]AYJ01381.1 hypothetical protein CWO85_02615 [Candidatus Phytoplasma ziziphi]
MRFPEFEKEWEEQSYLKEVTLKELVEIKTGEQLNRTKFQTHGKYYVMNGGNKPSGYYSQFNTPMNTITISQGGNCGYVHYHQVPFWCGAHAFKLIKCLQKINYSYLFHYLKKNEFCLKKLGYGTGLKNISKKSLESFSILYPLSLQEQNKIASFLSLLDERIKIQSEIIKDIELHQKYYLNQLIERQLRFPEFEKKEYHCYKLKELVEIKRGKRLLKKQLSTQLNEINQYPVISGGQKPLGFYHQYNAGKNTITIICFGSIGYVFYHNRPFWCSDSSFLINIKNELKSKNNTLFLFYYLKKLENQIKNYKIGTANPGLQTNFSEKILLYLPSLSEQNKIASFLSLLDEKQNLEKDLLQNYRFRKKYYLNHLLI